MSDRHAPNLRPRSVVQLYDAAFEAAATSPGVVGAALLGAAPVVAAFIALWYAAAEHALDTGDLRLLALGATLATFWRMVGAGAVSHVVLEGLSGREVGTAEAFGAALRRGLSLVAAGVLVWWVAAWSLALLFLPMLAWGGAGLAATLVMDRACAPWQVLGESRRRLGSRAIAAAGMTLLWLGAVGVVAVDLGVGMSLVVSLAQSFLDLDAGLLGRVLSLSNPIYAPTLLGLAFLLLEPVRHASLALLLADARVRQEGLDLAAALDALPSPETRRRGSRAAVLALLLVLPAAGWAQEQAPANRVLQAARWAAAEGADVDPEAVAEALERAGARGDELDRLADSVEEELHAGHVERAGARLRAATGELRSLGNTAAGADASAEAGGVDASALAAEVLARPEFRRLNPDAPRPEAAAGPKEPGWFERMLRRFLEWLRERERSDELQTERSRVFAPIQGVLWGVLVVALVGLVVFLVVRALGGAGAPARAPGATAGDGAGDGDEPARPSEGLLDPLSRPPDAWLGEADRLAREGALREAVRAAYLALLALLHRDRAIDYTATRTNWDHVRGYRGEDVGRRVFADLTRRFERSWYGLRRVTLDEYRTVRAGALDLGGAARAPAPAPTAPPGEAADA